MSADKQGLQFTTNLFRRIRRFLIIDKISLILAIYAAVIATTLSVGYVLIFGGAIRSFDHLWLLIVALPVFAIFWASPWLALVHSFLADGTKQPNHAMMLFKAVIVSGLTCYFWGNLFSFKLGLAISVMGIVTGYSYYFLTIHEKKLEPSEPLIRADEKQNNLATYSILVITAIATVATVQAFSACNGFGLTAYNYDRCVAAKKLLGIKGWAKGLDVFSVAELAGISSVLIFMSCPISITCCLLREKFPKTCATFFFVMLLGYLFVLFLSEPVQWGFR